MNKLQLLAAAVLVAISTQGFAQEKSTTRAEYADKGTNNVTEINIGNGEYVKSLSVANLDMQEQTRRDERMRSTLHTDTQPGSAPAYIQMAATQPEGAVSNVVNK